jgi:hypothetical protein
LPYVSTGTTRQKEIEVGERIIEAFEDSDWRFDGGACLRRPDVLLQLEKHVLIIEVDKNRHNTYECICENKRVIEIYQALGTPVVFIRFNPDALPTIMTRLLHPAGQLTNWA